MVSQVAAALALLVLAGAWGWWGGARWSRRRSQRSGSGLPGAQPLLQLLAAAPQGWLLVARDDRVLRCNIAAARLLEIAPALDRDGLALVAMPQGEALQQLVQLARERQRPQRSVCRPGPRPLELWALPAQAGWVALVLQERRSLEQQLEQQERWVSDVAHELRTPLTALLLVGDALAAQAAGPAAVLVERLRRELGRLRDLVQELLELSRLENLPLREGRGEAPVDLAALVRRVWANLSPLAVPRGLRLELHGEAQGPLPGDAPLLERAVLNLLDNAIRFSPDGAAVEVELRRRGDWCQLAVRDHGPGLSPADLEHAFERFYRGDPARARQSQRGSGLGLAIVQQIAHSQGGRAQAGNHPEGGAVLELFLPLRPPGVA